MAGHDAHVVVPPNVIVLASLDRSTAIAEALAEGGFAVALATGIPQIPSLAGVGQTFVPIVDDREPQWIRQVSDLVALRPGARPLALAMLEGPEEVLSALSAGVAGFVPPTAGTGAIVRSVRSIFDCGVAIPRGMVPALVAAVRHGRGHSVETPDGRIDLTDREWAILQLMIQRRTTREMAEALYVSVGTVRSHVSALLRKLGAEDREDVVRLIEHPRRSAS